jgi:hypothetical protein
VLAADLTNPLIGPGGETVHVGTAVADVALAGRTAEAGSELPLFVRAESARGIVGAVAPAWSGVGDRPVSVVISVSALKGYQEWRRDDSDGAGIVLVVPTASAGSMARAAAAIHNLVIDGGFGDRLAVGYNSDPINLMERFPVLLMEAGLSAAAVRRLLVENPARALTQRPRPDRSEST